MLLDRAAYFELVDEPGTRVEACADAVPQILAFLEQIWPTLNLKKRRLQDQDIVFVFRHAQRLFYHVRVYPRKQPQTFIIVATNEAGLPSDYILIDLAAEHVVPMFECPTFELEQVANEAMLREFLPKISASDQNPFAILARGEGTFMQTYHSEDGFLLEYQLVNTSSHYQAGTLLKAEQVVEAMVSYLANDNQWLTMFAWEKMEL